MNAFRVGDHVEVTDPQEGFEHRAGETGVVVGFSHDLVHVDDDGYRSSYYPHELSKR